MTLLEFPNVEELEVEKTPGGMRVVRPPPARAPLGLRAQAGCMPLLAVFLGGVTLLQLAAGEGAGLQGVLGSLVMAAYTALVGFHALGEWRNSLVMEVDGSSLRVFETPIALGRAQEIPREGILQLYVKKQLQTPHRRTLLPVPHFQVRVVCRGGREVPLDVRFDEAEPALRAERALEEGLGLRDVPLVGELDRDDPARRRVDREDPGRSASPSRPGPIEGAEAEDAALVDVRVEPVSETSEGACPICGERPEVAAVSCSECDVVHHLDCWRYNRGCATYACPGRPGEGAA